MKGAKHFTTTDDIFQAVARDVAVRYLLGVRGREMTYH
jgi:hypothetical protein